MASIDDKLRLPTAAEALPGRSQPIATTTTHFVCGGALKGPYPEGAELAQFALGCFWGAERYWVPISLPWRMPWVGSWFSQNSLSSCS